jgi:hypothetical protein
MKVYMAEDEEDDVEVHELKKESVVPGSLDFQLGRALATPRAATRKGHRRAHRLGV